MLTRCVACFFIVMLLLKQNAFQNLKFNKLNIVVSVGLVAIIGVLTMQLLMLNQAYTFEKKEIGEKIHFALQDVVDKIYRDNNNEPPTESPIRKVGEDYYVVNVNDVFDAEVLDYYLKTEFQKVKLDMDYEYAIYDCGSDEMVYGEYVAMHGTNATEDKAKCENCFTKRAGLVYYFAVRFPNLKYNYITSLQQYWIYTGVLFLVLVIYVYSVILMLKQKRYSEMQKDFINNMTHEFKTPLSSILIASNFAAGQQEIDSHPKLKKYLSIIIEQSNKLNQHIERILNVAKADANLTGLEKKKIDIVETLALVQENASLKYPDAKIKLEADSPMYMLSADGFHFYNIAYNIVENAVKYGGASPEITIKVMEDAKNLLITFTDNGPGIPARHIDYVFDKFYRVPRENKKEVGGFGIGLFYVKKICELHKWKINLRNNAGGGLSVTISMPKSSIL